MTDKTRHKSTMSVLDFLDSLEKDSKIRSLREELTDKKIENAQLQLKHEREIEKLKAEANRLLKAAEVKTIANPL